MNELIKDRVIKSAYLFLRNKSTIREVASDISFSKSTVHKDLSIRLKEIDPDLYESVRELLDYNQEIKHIRGGMSTKIRYQKAKRK